MASFVTKAVSYIVSSVTSSISKLGSWLATIGSRHELIEPSDIDPWQKLSPEAERAWSLLMTRALSPASGATPPTTPCNQYMYHSPYYGGHTVGCKREMNHARPHYGSFNFQGLAPSKRVNIDGIVHAVAWFDVIGNKRRMIFTCCGLHHETHNRTKNNKPVTCVSCACRSY